MTDVSMTQTHEEIDASVLGDGGADEYSFNPEDLDEKAVLGDDDLLMSEDARENNCSRVEIKKELNGDHQEAVAENDDLYDAALESSGAAAVESSNKRESVEVQSSLPSLVNQQQLSSYQSQSNAGTGSTSSNTGRRYCCYIGNLTWWTNDVDLQKAIEECGVFDLIDTKFFENRTNGQSKGYALGVFSSETSVKNLIERLPKIKLHDQAPTVLPYSKQSQVKLEETAKRNDPRNSNSADTKTSMKSGGGSQDDLSGPGTKSGMPYIGTIRIGPASATTQMQPIGLNQITAMPPRPLPGGTGGGGSQQQGVVSSAVGSGMGNNSLGVQHQANLSQLQFSGVRATHPITSIASGVATNLLQQTLQPLLQQRLPTATGLNLAAATAPVFSLNQQITGLTTQMNRPPPNFGVQNALSGNMGHGQMHSGQINTSAPPPTLGGKVMGGHHGGGMPPNFPPPGAHINPQMYPGFAHHNYGHGHDNGAMLSDAEFEEIMNRNRTVSSSAISRAVSDAANGEYGSAIETLLTAISLIRQSRVAHDDRCKVLVASLQDTLNMIESKSYMHKSRRRDRSRSEERGRKRHRRVSRSRSRSPRGGGYGGGGDGYSGYRGGRY